MSGIVYTKCLGSTPIVVGTGAFKALDLGYRLPDLQGLQPLSEAQYVEGLQTLSCRDFWEAISRQSADGPPLSPVNGGGVSARNFVIDPWPFVDWCLSANSVLVLKTSGDPSPPVEAIGQSYINGAIALNDAANSAYPSLMLFAQSRVVGLYLLDAMSDPWYGVVAAFEGLFLARYEGEALGRHVYRYAEPIDGMLHFENLSPVFPAKWAGLDDLIMCLFFGTSLLWEYDLRVFDLAGEAVLLAPGTPSTSTAITNSRYVPRPPAFNTPFEKVNFIPYPDALAMRPDCFDSRINFSVKGGVGGFLTRGDEGADLVPEASQPYTDSPLALANYTLPITGFLK